MHRGQPATSATNRSTDSIDNDDRAHGPSVIVSSASSATFNKTFAGLATNVFAGVDLVVQPEQGFSLSEIGDAETPLADSVVDTARSTPGVTRAQPWSSKPVEALTAAGMTRSQVRSTIRREAILITLYGVLFGLAVGSVVGWATTRTMTTLGVDRVAFAPGRLAAYAVVGIVAGIASAALPARRSARLDVLAALRHT
jgi:FtsX-like permease family